MKLNCLPLCDPIFKKIWMHRPHLSCLTCPPRRYYYFGEKSGFVKVPHATIMATTASGRAVKVPNPEFLTYFLMVKLNSHFSKVKDLIVKCLMIWLEKLTGWRVKAEQFKRFAIFVLEKPTGLILAKEFKAYFILIPTDSVLKRYPIKFGCTVAECIAQV